jgi:zinc protease
MSRAAASPRPIALALCTLITLTAGLATPARALEIKRLKLSNGAVLLVSEQHQLPMVSLAIAFDAGARRDPPGKEGLASLTADSLMQGTKDLSATQFNQRIDFTGGNMSIGASRDYASASLTALTKYRDDTLHLLAQALENPGLRDADIERKRAERVADINAAQEQPQYVAQVAFEKAIFDSGPYGHPAEGFAESVSKLTATDVRDFYKNYYRMGSAVIAVTGDVDAGQIRAKLEKEFSSLPGTVAPQAPPHMPVIKPGIHVQLIDRNVAQANLILGSVGIARSNPDFYKIQVMNYILGGGGFSSRLMKVVRSKAGLAYGIGSGFQATKFPGAFLVVLQTKNESANQALRMILEQLREIQEAPVSETDIASAKKYLIGSFPLKLDRQSEIVSFMLQIELEGLGTDYAERYPKLIEAVTRADVQDVARRYIHPDALVLIAVANQGTARINTAALEPEKRASR